MFPEGNIYKMLQTVFLCKIAHYGKGLIFVCQEIFGSTDKICFLWGGGNTRSKSLKIFQIYSNFYDSKY